MTQDHKYFAPDAPRRPKYVPVEPELELDALDIAISLIGLAALAALSFCVGLIAAGTMSQ